MPGGENRAYQWAGVILWGWYITSPHVGKWVHRGRLVDDAVPYTSSVLLVRC